MTSKKPPPKKSPEDGSSSEDPLAGQPVEVIIEVLAKLSGQMKGLDGAELRRHVTQITGQLQSLTTRVEQSFKQEATRKEAAAEVERLVDFLVRTGTAAGKALEKQRTPIAQAFQGADIDKLAEGMRKLADFMQNPTPQTEAEAKTLLDELKTTMGAKVGYDPEVEEKRRQAQIKADVAKSLGEVLGKDFRPKIKPFEPPPQIVKKPDDTKGGKK
jgi:hypothetical protein